MRLVIGGYGQGKLGFVLRSLDGRDYGVWYGKLPGDGHGESPENGKLSEDGEPGGRFIIVNHFHRWVKRRLTDGGCPEEEIGDFLERYGECAIICDEIGNGIVPGDRFEREYRERTGRILIDLAARAERVERVICGIGQRIK